MKALALVPLLLATSSVAQPIPPREIPWNAIALLNCGKALGTAFHIGNGRYITAHHVISEGSGKCYIGLTQVTVTYTDKALDLVELSGPVIADKFLIDCTGFHSGREYLAVGYAEGVSRTNIPLIYSSFGKGDDNIGQFVGAEMIPGMSGGPMIDGQYMVSGINLERWPSRGLSLSETYLCKGGVA